MNPDLQRLQDMLTAMQQHDQALNVFVVAQQVENAVLRKTLDGRDSRIKAPGSEPTCTRCHGMRV